MSTNFFKNSKILISGGTGSFGETFLQKLIQNNDINEIRIFSRDEKKQEDLRRKLNSEKVTFLIGDVRDYQSTLRATHNIDHIFQAAALKQVPSCEFYPMEALKTNALGTNNLLEAAAINDVKNIVVLSTDKAVYPINAMGISKAMMERIAISKARETELSKSVNLKINVTRYGNVMCSRGSLIPFIIQRIKDGKDLTVTNPNMTRFMMSLDESVELVIKAFEEGHNGDLFVHKSPAATVIDTVEAIKSIFKSNLKVKIIGSRHGEKMHETLCSSEEMSISEDLGKFYRIPADLRNINYDLHERVSLDNELTKPYDSSNTQRLGREEVMNLLLEQPYVKKELEL